VIPLAPPNGLGAGELLDLIEHAPRWLDARVTRAVRARQAWALGRHAPTAGPEMRLIDVTV
jgi:hypothetical protein